MARANYLDPVVFLRVVDANNSQRFLDFSPHQRRYRAKPETSVNLPYLSSLNITTVLGTSNDIKCNLQVPHDLFEPMMENWFDLFTLGQTIQAQIGYSKGDLRTRQFSASLTSAPRVSGGVDFFSIDLEGKGSLWFSSRRSRSFRAKGRSVFEIINKILGAYSSVFYTVNEDGNEVPLTAAKAASAFPVLVSLVLDEVLMGSEFEVIRDLIIVRCQLGFYISGNRFVLYDPAKSKQFNRDFVFEYRSGRVDLASGIIPIESFSSPNSQLPFAKATGNIATKDQSLKKDEQPSRDVMTRDDERVNLVQTRPNSRDDKVNAENKVFGDRPNVPAQKVPISSTDPARQAKLAYMKRRAEEISGSQLQWTTIGVPIIFPSEIATIRGCTFLYDGRYQIQSIDLGFDGSGFATTFSGFAPGQSPGATSVLTDLAKRVEQQKVNSSSRVIDSTLRGTARSLEDDTPTNMGLNSVTPDEGLA